MVISKREFEDKAITPEEKKTLDMLEMMIDRKIREEYKLDARLIVDISFIPAELVARKLWQKYGAAGWCIQFYKDNEGGMLIVLS